MLPFTPDHRQKVDRVKAEVMDSMLTLLLGGLGLVAALAWNDAIRSLFEQLFPQGGGLVYKFVYAVMITVIVVLISMRLRKLKEKKADQAS